MFVQLTIIVNHICIYIHIIYFYKISFDKFLRDREIDLYLGEFINEFSTLKYKEDSIRTMVSVLEFLKDDS